MEAAASGQRAKRRERKVRVDLTLCRYEVVRKIVRDRGWVIVSDESDPRAVAACNLHWVDVPEVQGKFTSLLPYQKLNHFPGMSNLARKSRLARNFDRLRKLFPDEYDFCPKTWILPFDLHDFQQYFNAEGVSARPFIIKPDHSCQGRGVFLTRHLKEINKNDIMVAQQYVARPLLIEGKKFDLRIYVLVASCDPLRVYLFEDGLVRMCTADYVVPNDANLEQRFMHLTNYAVNKRAANFERNQDAAADGSGSKRSLRWFFSWLRSSLANSDDHPSSSMTPDERVDKLWQQVGDICLKSILTVQPVLAQEYRSTFAKYLRHAYSAGPTVSMASAASTSANRPASAQPASSSSTAAAGNPSQNSCCFALLGMDVLVDENLKPWLLEVNHLPSFGCDSPLDWNIKERLISQTFDILGISPDDKDRYDEAQARSTQQRLYGASGVGGGRDVSKPDNQLADLPLIKGKSQRQQTQQPETDGPESPSTGSDGSGKDDDNDSSWSTDGDRRERVTKREKQQWSLDVLREVLARYYAAMAPERATDVDKIMAKYAERQDALDRHLAKKYGRRLAEFVDDTACTPDSNSKTKTQAKASPTAADCESSEDAAEPPQPERHDDTEQLVDFVRIYPPPGAPLLESKYRKMLDASQSHMSELQMRFSAPLQHRRQQEDDGNASALPPISGAIRRDQQVGRDCFGFTGTDKARWLLGDHGDKKAAVVPGPQQIAAAHRLMMGHSSQKTSIKPPTPPEKMPRARQESVNYGLQYRDRLATLKQKPTIAMAQISFGCFD